MSVELGSDAVFKLDDSTGSNLVDLSAYLTDCGMTRSVDALEKTHFGDTAKKYFPGLEDGQISVSGDYDPTLDAHLDGIVRVADLDWEYYPQGNASGDPKYSGQCILTSFNPSGNVAELGKIGFELQVSGGVTRALVP